MNFFTAADSSAPLSTLDILFRTFLIYFLNIVPILSISAMFIPTALIIIYCGWQYFDNDKYIPFAVATLCGRMLLHVILPVAMCNIAVNAHAQRRSTFRDVMGTSLTHACGVAIALWLGSSLASVGYCFLLWPGVYLNLGWVLTTPAIVVENRGTIGGMSRSWDLTSGERIGLLVTWLFFWITVSGLVVLATSLFVTHLAWNTEDLDIQEIIAQNSANVRSASVFAIVLLVATVVPLQNIFATVLYFDVRARKESYSAARLSSQLDLHGAVGLSVSLLSDANSSTAKETIASEIVPDRASGGPSTPAWAIGVV